MGTKTSTGQKALYAAYAGDSRATKNKAKRIARHVKKHPNDRQSAIQAPGSKLTHDKRTPLQAKVERAVTHHTLFGIAKKESAGKSIGRDLSTKASRKPYLMTSADRAAALKKNAAVKKAA